MKDHRQTGSGFAPWPGEGGGLWYPKEILRHIQRQLKFDTADASLYEGPPEHRGVAVLRTEAPPPGVNSSVRRQAVPPSFEDVAFGDAHASAMDVDFRSPDDFRAGGCSRRKAYRWWRRITRGHPDRARILRWMRGLRTRDLLVTEPVDEVVPGCGTRDHQPVRARFDPNTQDRPPLYGATPRTWAFRNSKKCTTSEKSGGFRDFMRAAIKADLAGGQLIEWVMDDHPSARLPRQTCPQSVEPEKPRRCCNQRAWNEFYRNPSCRYDGAHTVFESASAHSYMYAYDHKRYFPPARTAMLWSSTPPSFSLFARFQVLSRSPPP